MGNGQTVSVQDESTIIALMMPMYYIPDNTVTFADIDFLRDIWQRIMTNNTYPYQRLRRTVTESDSCLSWFYSVFFNRLFAIYPTCKSIFDENEQYRAKFLLRLVTTSLMIPEHNPQYTTALRDLTTDLSSKGFRPYELGVLGDVLFYALECICGEGYTATVDFCWKKVFSHLLLKAVPLCLENEKKPSNAKRSHVTLQNTPLASSDSAGDSSKSKLSNKEE